jgi:CBS domain-containing protein
MMDKEITSERPEGYRKLEQISAQLNDRVAPQPATVRELLQWFGAKRRGSGTVYTIKGALYDKNLRTEPSFELQYLDGPLEFKIGKREGDVFRFDEDSAASTSSAEILLFPSVQRGPGGRLIITDPTYRIGRLPSANVVPISVTPNTSLSAAITLMLANDFSQLPVMIGQRDPKGVISWVSIGTRLALGRQCTEVRECMDAPRIISSDTSMFDAIREIVRDQYVLIKDSGNKISGVVTTSDLCDLFRERTEPFLLLGEIENHIRTIIIRGNLTCEELTAAADPPRSVENVFDLSFGEYIRLLEKPELWVRLGLSIDRKLFVGMLERGRQIRNDVMHFDPDGVSDDDLGFLRKFVGFLQKIKFTAVPQRDDHH